MNLHSNLEHASVITYSGAAATTVFWGLHLSDICMIVSASAAVGGFALQLWVARIKVELMQRSERWKKGDK